MKEIEAGKIELADREEQIDGLKSHKSARNERQYASQGKEWALLYDYTIKMRISEYREMIDIIAITPDASKLFETTVSSRSIYIKIANLELSVWLFI